jgi:hypothetical protein
MTPTTSQPNVSLDDLLAAWAACGYRYGVALKDDSVGRQLLSANAEAQLRFVLAAVAWLSDPPTLSQGASPWYVIEVLTTLLRRKLPFAEDDVVALLRWAAHDSGSWRVLPHLEPRACLL